MMKRFNERSIFLACVVVIVVLALLYGVFGRSEPIKSDIVALTDKFIHGVTVTHDPQEVADLFCKDGSLVGTVSQIHRQGRDIKLYFNYFAKLPEIRVIEKTYDILEVTPDVFINTAFITWTWKGLKEPVVARMTFVVRNNCIFQLHSSKLPSLNEDLVALTKRLV